MTTLSPFALILSVMVERITGDHYVALTNLGVVFSTLLLVGVTVHSAHATIKEVVKSDNRLIARLLGPLLVKPEPGEHKRNKE